ARRQVSPKTIGAVLPLSGRHANVAQKTLRGLQLGLGIYGPERSEFRLAVIDSEGNPDQARRAVERLVTEDHVIAIVGSLLSREAMAVASKADELGVPSINLSQRTGITEVGNTVFRNSITSEMQVRHLVREAMEHMGLKKFAILYPNDPYGVEYANLFWDEVLARGGQITAAQTYNSKDTNFGEPVQRLIGTYYLEDRLPEYKATVRNWYKDNPSPRARETMPDDILSPIVDFDAIFIPDSIRAVAQIAPTLAFHNISHVRLLGTNLWNSETLPERGNRHVEDALFVDTLLATDQKFKDSNFVKLYKSVFGEEPGLFELQGYDTGIILRTFIASGARTRGGLSQSLRSSHTVPGATGPLQVDSSREFHRPLVSLTIQGGKIIKLADAKLLEPVKEPAPK
ncbi:MAG: penicillin-binding protein activator, partial [Bdellovibrionales bacterium]|nr:penicillin-binding protein activator [Bdellovibrionales bacterium]